ncbi:MAG: riboflavin synthase [Chloroflexi bacterium]|nr:riboflavin synthase [Chloroflexota bacterium]
MFSGIVEEVGRLVSFDGARVVVSAGKVLEDLGVSDSIGLAGTCLTVVERDEKTFTVQVVPETLHRTNLGALKTGDGINLEGSLAWGERVGGHMVQGHIDCVVTVQSIVPEGNSRIVRFKAPERIMRYVVEKGFVALDGVSMTVVDRDDESFSVAVIPFTWDNTTFCERGIGAGLNLEADVTAKYIEQLIIPYVSPGDVPEQ